MLNKLPELLAKGSHWRQEAAKFDKVIATPLASAIDQLERVLGDDLSPMTALAASPRLDGFRGTKTQLVRLRKVTLRQPRVLGTTWRDKNAPLNFSVVGERAREHFAAVRMTARSFRIALAGRRIHATLAVEAQQRLSHSLFRAANELVPFTALHCAMVQAGAEVVPQDSLPPTDRLCCNYAKLVEAVKLASGIDRRDLEGSSIEEHAKLCSAVLQINGYKAPPGLEYPRGLLFWLLLCNAAGLLIVPEALPVASLREWRVTTLPDLSVLPALPFITESPADLPVLIVGLALCRAVDMGLSDTRALAEAGEVGTGDAGPIEVVRPPKRKREPKVPKVPQAGAGRGVERHKKAKKKAAGDGGAL